MKLYVSVKDFPINYPVYHLIAQKYEHAKYFAEQNNWPKCIWSYINERSNLFGKEGFIIYVDYPFYLYKKEYDQEFFKLLKSVIDYGRLHVIKESEYSHDLINEM